MLVEKGTRIKRYPNVYNRNTPRVTLALALCLCQFSFPSSYCRHHFSSVTKTGVGKICVIPCLLRFTFLVSFFFMFNQYNFLTLHFFSFYFELILALKFCNVSFKYSAKSFYSVSVYICVRVVKVCMCPAFSLQLSHE